jgi:putative N6-adenine-specific DNA methylase
MNDNDAPPTWELFAVTARGLEPVCAAELAGLGVTARVEEGGVAWQGDLASLYRANVELRTASRVIARIGEFRARTFAELERHAAKLPWERFLEPAATVSLRVTCRKSKLYHAGAVAERVARVLGDRVGARIELAAGGAATAEDGGDGEDTAAAGGAQLLVVRFMRDVCTISADTSGALLHQRGYRQAVAKAPLRETLAAALLLGSGWRGTTPLLDPLCGSGTIAIEAALIARRIAPGLAIANRRGRSYAFEGWPGYDARTLGAVLTSARERILPHAGIPIVGADRSAAAIAAARSNAERAGVAADIEFVQRPLSALEAWPGTGHLVTNPPYGVRVGEQNELAPLYAALGRAAQDRLEDWTVALFAAEPRLATATGLPLREIFETRNGGIPVRALCAGCP